MKNNKMNPILFAVFLVEAVRAVKRGMKYHSLSLYGSVKEEIDMAFHVMGPKLYYKYLTGTAVAGVDFEE